MILRGHSAIKAVLCAHLVELGFPGPQIICARDLSQMLMPALTMTGDAAFTHLLAGTRGLHIQGWFRIPPWQIRAVGGVCSIRAHARLHVLLRPT